MPYGFISDDLYDHPKIRALLKDRPDGLSLWLLALSWSGKQQTDGFIPSWVPRHVTGWAASRVALAVAALVRVGLWDLAEGGWYIHGWEKHHKTKATRDAERAAKADAGRRGGQARVQAEKVPRDRGRFQAREPARVVARVGPTDHGVPDE
jgi:hypothetical protein